MVYSVKFSWILVLALSLLLCRGVNSQTSEEDKKTIGLIAGCVGGGVVLLILIVVVCFFACRRDKEKDLYARNLGQTYPPYINNNNTKNSVLEQHHPNVNDIGRSGSGLGTKSAPSSDMSTQFSVPPGVWQANPTMFAGHPAQAYVLAHNRESPRGTHQSSREVPPMHGSYSNEPMLTPRKKASWYNRTWRRAQNAFRQIPTVFQVKRSTSEKENHPYPSEEYHNTTMPHERHRHPPDQNKHSSAVKEMDHGDIRNEQRSERKNSSKSHKMKKSPSNTQNNDKGPVRVPKDPHDEVVRVHTRSREEIARAHTGDPRNSYTTLPTKIEETDEDENSPAVPSGPYVAKVYSDYREPQDRVHQPDETSENVAKAFSSYQHLDSGSYQKDPYIARANVKNRHSVEILQPSNIQHMTQSDFSLHKQGRPLGRTHSEMVKNGAGMYMAQGKYTAPPHYYGNKPIILSPNNFVGRQPYGKGVLMRAPGNVGGFNSRQTHSLDRFNNYDQRVTGGVKQKSVFAAPPEHDVVRGNFIMRSNTFTLQDSTNQQSYKPVVKQGKSQGVVMRDKFSKERKPSKKQQKQEHKPYSPVTVETVPMPENKEKPILRGKNIDDPNALYAKPMKPKRDSLLEQKKTEVTKNSNVEDGDKHQPKAQTSNENHVKDVENKTDNKPAEPRASNASEKSSSPVAMEKIPAKPKVDKNVDDEPRKRLKSVSSADVELSEGKNVTADAFRFLEEFDDGNISVGDDE